MATVEKKDWRDVTDANGKFNRKPSAFRSFISADPSSPFPAEKDRYVLYINLGCPWAHRTNIVRSLKGLEDVIQLVILDGMDPENGWCWTGEAKDGAEKKDPLYGFSFLRDLYEKAEPGYIGKGGRFLVPCLWDKKKETIVSNESSEIIRMFYTEFDAFIPEQLRESSKGQKGLFPEHLRNDIEGMNTWVYDNINNGVYKTGFATSQAAYEENVFPLFKSLDRLEKHLGEPGHSPYLFGDHITEADIRLYPTLIRFDIAYHTIFKCNLKMIRHDYPRLNEWLKRLYWDESERTNGGAFKKTVLFRIYKWAYTKATKGQVVPVGPEVDIEPL
ncbi:glutathione S-transferase [Zopfia rhizophila CBS 207.26]|uniref:Glutathione S-transferase n=1 Tax=Zopfia rhizophila CBS 207.26 TaxID=1314779 RepID=A0A6A6DME4_9PEZI|nr:glutathione S-transferase [Zopfia rhizophila CBS 207.26]